MRRSGGRRAQTSDASGPPSFFAMKFALLSDELPPKWSGQSLVIKRLLEDLAPERYCLIARASSDAAPAHADGRLPGRHYLLPHEPVLRGHRFGLPHLHNRYLYTLVANLYARRLARILKAEHCTAVVACTDYLLDVPAGYRASRLAGVPFYVYVFDDYGRKWIPREQRAFAAHVEPAAYKAAARLIVPNEFMRRALHARYGVEPMVIHNPCDLSLYETLNAETDEAPAAAPRTEFRIGFTGAVYDAHYDAFRNLIKGIALLADADVRLHIYTSYAHDKLRARGLTGPVVYHAHAAPHLMPGIQRESDVLFLPLAFDSPYPEVIRTSAPGKLGEYLAVGRPVLVHAPADSFVAWYFRTHVCGLVVSERDPAALAAAIKQLRTDAALRQRLSHNAQQRAQEDFSIAAARTRFAHVLGLDADASAGRERA